MLREHELMLQNGKKVQGRVWKGLMVYLGIVQGELVLWALEHPLTTNRRNTHVKRSSWLFRRPWIIYAQKITLTFYKKPGPRFVFIQKPRSVWTQRFVKSTWAQKFPEQRIETNYPIPSLPHSWPIMQLHKHIEIIFCKQLTLYL